MSEFERVPDPEMNGEALPFTFEGLNAEDVPPIVSDFSTPDAKAGKRRWWEPKPKSEKKPRERKQRETPPLPRGGLRPQLENFYMGIGVAVTALDPSCGQLVMTNASACAEAMDEWAKTDPAIRNFLIRLVSVSAAGKVFYAHLPIFVGMAMHHVPALRERQEKMIGDFAEMMANGFPNTGEDTEK